jgi:hypothetical protein
MATYTVIPWGMSVLDKDFATGEARKEGAMIVSPPPMEAVRRTMARDLPFTSRRVALLNASPYTPHEVCVENARRIVACVNACEGIDTETLERAANISDPVHRLAALSFAAKGTAIRLEGMDS